MFSLSLRVTGHPCVFHHTRVRSSTQFYLSFNLPVTRSLGFGSTTTNYKTLSGFSPFSDSVSLRLRRFHALTSLAIVTRRLILQKARHHTLADALTCCGFMVSGSLSLPSPGFFSPFPHGTSALSVVAEYLALDRGRPRFRQGFSCLAVLRYRITESYLFRLRGFHPLWPAFPEPFLYRYDFLLRGLRPCGPTTPASAGLGSSNFARRYFRNHSCFLFPGYVRWFSSPSIASAAYIFSSRMTDSRLPGYPIRLSRHLRMCAPPPGFSQLTTAFFASRLLGIHL